jgi:aspartate-semialdehyde dehydrogenase
LSSASAEYGRILNYIGLYEGRFEDLFVREIRKDNKHAVVTFSSASNTANIRQYVLENDNGFWEVVYPNVQLDIYPINAINKLSPIKAMYASTYQATSGAGAAGPVEMYDESEKILAARAAGGKGNSYGAEFEPKVFQHQIAFNVIPQIGGFGENLYSSEEMKLQNEGRKIMHLPELKVSCTCVRVPVERSHAISANVITEEKLDLDEVRKAIAEAPGAKLYDDGDNHVYPMPIVTSNQDIVYVGRIRRDLVCENGINLWCCGDQVRKGAATNAVQIAELLTK